LAVRACVLRLRAGVQSARVHWALRWRCFSCSLLLLYNDCRGTRRAAFDI